MDGVLPLEGTIGNNEIIDREKREMKKKDE